MKLPRLRAKEELLKSSPEISKMLREPDDENNGLQQSPTKVVHNDRSNNLSRQAKSQERVATGETEENEDNTTNLEMEEVKRERAALMQQLAYVKNELVGSAGGEAQQADLRQLEKELDLKKEKLNELRQEVQKNTGQISSMKIMTSDAKLMTPGLEPGFEASIEQLNCDMKQIEEELIEAEAKNRLYYLLSERTSRDHLAMQKKVRELREMKDNCLEDHSTLTQHLHEMRAGREDTEREAHKMRKMYDESRQDWQRKLKDRRREVRSLEKRQARERDKDDKRRRRVTEREKIEREATAKIQMEHEAYEMQIQALAPKIEAMEASWNRLKTISGANSPDDVIAYWEGLKSKEENLRELVKLAEKREERCKQQINKLYQTRSEMYEQNNTPLDGNQEVAQYQQQIAVAKQKTTNFTYLYNRLQRVYVDVEQGTQSLLQRLNLSLKVEVEQDQQQNKNEEQTENAQGTEADKQRSNTEIGQDKSLADDSRPNLANLLASTQEALMQLVEAVGYMQKQEQDELTGKQTISGTFNNWSGPPWLANILFSQKGYSYLQEQVAGQRKNKLPHNQMQNQNYLARVVGQFSPFDEQIDHDDDYGQDGEALLDREFIKHRAMKMTNRLAIEKINQ